LGNAIKTNIIMCRPGAAHQNLDVTIALNVALPLNDFAINQSMPETMTRISVPAKKTCQNEKGRFKEISV